MTFLIVGASASGLYTSIFLKRKHSDAKVIVFERNAKPGRKLNATGNGHCNLLNLLFDGSYFNNPEFVNLLLEEFPLETMLRAIESFGVPLLNKGDLVYPLSYSAKTYAETLFTLAKKLGVEFNFGIEVSDFKPKGNQIEVSFSNGKLITDKLILATGGRSQSKLGSDGKIIDLLNRKGIDIIPLTPSLCPLKTEEKTKALSGVRHGAKISLFSSGQCLYEEMGEVLFKDDGLSGIAIFNASSFIARNPGQYEIQIDFFPEMELGQLESKMKEAKEVLGEGYLEAILEEKFAAEIRAKFRKNGTKDKEIADICGYLKKASFHVKGLYGFEDSQVSHGGVSLEEINPDLSLSKFPNVHLVGEIIDIDGRCGGFNLGWCLLSSLKVAKVL